MIGALIGKCLLTVGLFKSNIDADTFFGWTVHDLLPKLPPASVVVMDNATFHKRQDIQNAITQARHTLEYLPACLPTLTPLSTNGLKPKQSENNKTKLSGATLRQTWNHHTPPTPALSNTSCNSTLSSSSDRFARLRRLRLATGAAILPVARLQ